MRAQACARCWRIRLDCIAFVKESFLIELSQQPPHGFNVAVVVGNIRVGHIHPIAHVVGERFPFAGKFHYLTAAGVVVFVNGDFTSDVFFCDT